MKIHKQMLILFYSLTVISFFIPFLKIDLTDYEGDIIVLIGYDNLYFYINLIILIFFNFILKKSVLSFTISIVGLSIVLALEIMSTVFHPFTFGTHSYQFGFYLHYFSISIIMYINNKSIDMQS